MAIAAAVVVLPTPPEPAQITTRFPSMKRSTDSVIAGRKD